MRRFVVRRWPWLLFVSAIALSFGAAWSVSLAVRLPAPERFNVVRWELRHVPDKWLYLTGRVFRGRLSRDVEDATLGRYLELTLRIELLRANPAQPGASEQVAGLERERGGIKNDAEAIVEGRITAVLEDAGLQSSLPLFPEARWVFPPVDVEFGAAPNELAISPRNRIALTGERALEPGLSSEKIAAIEQAAERDGARSALVEPLAGVATYPSIVAPDWDYQTLVGLTAHEWVHQYLFFRPLGIRFYSNTELRTLNETVATIAGDEIARLVVQRYPLPAAVSARLAAREPARPPVDVGQALRSLRRDVDALLGQGQVAAAEALMEQRRRQLAEQGVHFRRINQAFFAFANIYGTNPASTDPIGPKVRALQDRTQTVGAFLRAAARLTGVGDLDRLLAGFTSPGGTGR